MAWTKAKTALGVGMATLLPTVTAIIILADSRLQPTLKQATTTNGIVAVPDVIEQVVRYVEWWQSNAVANDYGRLFPGPTRMLTMPSNIPLSEVAGAALKADEWALKADEWAALKPDQWGQYHSRWLNDFNATNFTVLTIRSVHICGVPSLEHVANNNYFAALLQTHFGLRVVLLQFNHGYWWHRTYNPTNLWDATTTPPPVKGQREPHGADP